MFSRSLGTAVVALLSMFGHSARENDQKAVCLQEDAGRAVSAQVPTPLLSYLAVPMC